MNDLVLAAAYRALAPEALGREVGPPDRDHRRSPALVPPEYARPAVCNLSSLETPFLIRQLGGSFDETLANVSA